MVDVFLCESDSVACDVVGRLTDCCLVYGVPYCDAGCVVPLQVLVPDALREKGLLLRVGL